ncbi:hypothetical protein DE146DRAFT_145288 [Phaeosphaeria sp. MPI-PUGE-AT-0046c]|nr:hypothetical protein DE146DRAFT_145288 [Phaeosphaeria sp. MPI-PUGE-AT-0046c]
MSEEWSIDVDHSPQPHRGSWLISSQRSSAYTANMLLNLNTNYLRDSPIDLLTTQSTMIEKPPPHSAAAISARRVGGKKVPKRYRKYHQTHKRNDKGKGQGATKAVGWLIKGMRAAFESLQ